MKRIDIKKFQEFGYLQEVNRRFLHPLGLALEIVIDNETGDMVLGGIWDYQDYPEGMIFADGEIDQEKAQRIQKIWDEKAKHRIQQLGYVVQPVE
jgi:hypothetical protein